MNPWLLFFVLVAGCFAIPFVGYAIADRFVARR